MKKFSKFLIAILAVLTVSAGFYGCKKGDEDPGISLHGRKGRVVGEWTVSEMESKSDWTYTNSDPDPTAGSVDEIKNEGTSEMKYDGKAITESSTSKSTKDNGNFTSTKTNSSGSSTTQDVTVNSSGVSVTSTSSGNYSHTYDVKYTFEKDGKFKMTSTRKRTEEYKSSEPTSVSHPVSEWDRTATNTYDETVTTEGTWAFIGKDKTNEFKNKERIGLWYSSESTKTTNEDKTVYVDKAVGGTWSKSNITDKDDGTSSYTNKDSNPDEVWELVELKNKEMKVIASGKSTSDGSNTNSHTSYNIAAANFITTSTTSSTNRINNWSMSATLTGGK